MYFRPYEMDTYVGEVDALIDGKILILCRTI